MRVTVHIPESVNNEIRRAAAKEKKSVSSFIAEAAKYYIRLFFDSCKSQRAGNQHQYCIGVWKLLKR